MSFVGSEDYIRAQFEEYLLALLSSVKYDNYIQLHSQPESPLLPDIEGNPARDFGVAWIDLWRHTNNYAIWMSLTDAELFDIVEPRHPCAGTSTLSLEDMQLRVAQKMQDLKIDEKMVASKEVLSRTWVQGSSRVRGAVGSALANLDQYRQSQKKPTTPQPSTDNPIEEKQEEGETKEIGGENGTRKETFVGGWAAWAAEKRKKAFQKEEPSRVERVDIGPAPARPLAMWAARKKSSESAAERKEESVRSSSDTQVESVEKGQDSER